MAWFPWSEWRRGGASRGGGGGRRNIISGVHDATGEEGEVLSPGGSVKDRTKASFVSLERGTVVAVTGVTGVAGGAIMMM